MVTAIKNGDYFNLKNTIQYIKAPTLVLWGKHDKVVPFKSAEYFNDHIRTSKLQILNNASHSPQLEIPNEVANAINQFIIKPTYNKMERTKKSHLAKVQLYRWYQLYEREINNNRINNQMEILSEDVTITSAAGTMKGKENYPERLDAYKGWKNAHHVKNVNIIENENGSFNLEADIHYQNIKPDNAKSSYSIHYSNTLENTSDTFPIFSSINIKSTGELNKDFKDGYPENRAKSLMHYWLALMESLDGNSEPFKELLAENFELQFSTQSNITSIEQLHKWLNGTPLGLKQSNHYPENFSIKEVGKNLYEVIVEFDWYGFTKDNKKVKAKTHHTWLVTDNINDRFAKIKKVVVKQIEPFKVVE